MTTLEASLSGLHLPPDQVMGTLACFSWRWRRTGFSSFWAPKEIRWNGVGGKQQQQQQQPTTTNNNQQQPTTTNNKQQQTTTNNNKQQQTTTNNNKQQQTTTNNNKQQQTTTNNNQQQQQQQQQQPQPQRPIIHFWYPPLKLTANSPPKIGLNAPKRKRATLPIIHFQVPVSFHHPSPSTQRKSNVPPSQVEPCRYCLSFYAFCCQSTWKNPTIHKISVWVKEKKHTYFFGGSTYYMGVCKTRGTPKWMVCNGKWIILGGNPLLL